MEILWRWESWSEGKLVHSSFVWAWSNSEANAFPQNIGWTHPRFCSSASLAIPGGKFYFFPSSVQVSFPACFFFLTCVQTHLVPICLIGFPTSSCVWKYSISNTWSPCPTPEKEIVVVKGLEQELNLAYLRVVITTEFINLQLWLRQAFSLLFPLPFPSSSWLLVLVWLFLHHGCEYDYRICWTGELFWIEKIIMILAVQITFQLIHFLRRLHKRLCWEDTVRTRIGGGAGMASAGKSIIAAKASVPGKCCESKGKVDQVTRYGVGSGSTWSRVLDEVSSRGPFQP